MSAISTAKMVRISSRKSRLVIDMIRGKSVEEARVILANYNNRSAYYVSKVLNSAVANAVNNNNMNEDALFVTDCYVNDGPTIKRVVPDSRGRYARNDHRTCHISVVVDYKN